MTSLSSTTTPEAPRAVSAKLHVVAGSHAVVDFFSAIVIPITAVLLGQVQATPTFGAMLIAIGSLSSGLIQPVVAQLGDKLDTRWFGTIGFFFAVVAFSLVGLASEPWHLVVLQLVGCAGSGAFHPVAAAAVGQLSRTRRTLGVSIFHSAGVFGSVVGSAMMPFYVREYGAPALLWLALPGLVLVGVLAATIHATPHIAPHAAREHAELPESERRRRWRLVGLLYAGNVLRFNVNMMLVWLFLELAQQVVLRRSGSEVFTTQLRVESSTINGPLQAAMQAGMGVGGLTLGLLLPRAHERVALLLLPLVGAAGIACFPLLPRDGTLLAMGLVLSLLAGVGFAGVMPVTISMAQRLLPHRTGVASGLMMGGAWGLAALGPPLAQFMIARVGLSTSFLITSALLASSGLLALPAWRSWRNV